MNNTRLAWIATHPTQYQASLLRAIAKTPHIDLTVFFFSDFSIHQYTDKEFKQTITWDTPLIDGYKHKFISKAQKPINSIRFTTPKIHSLKNHLTSKDFDAVLVQGWNHYGQIEAAYWAKKNNLKVLLRCEATDHVSGSKGLKRWLRDKVVQYVLSKVDICMAIGSKNRDFYLDRGISSDNIGFMPYCVDNDYFRSKAEITNIDSLKTSLSLDPKRPIILYASKLTKRKCADLLLKAYLKLEKTRPYLLFIGDGELRAELEQQVDLHNSREDVRFLGFKNQAELPSFYALANIFVLPSVNETWGLVINEAMNAGCAILATDQVGSAVDLIKNGENGYIISPYNIDELKEALAKMLDNDIYKAMGEQSKIIISNWGIKENISGLQKALNMGASC